MATTSGSTTTVYDSIRDERIDVPILSDTVAAKR
jgi:hypothetical protein